MWNMNPFVLHWAGGCGWLSLVQEARVQPGVHPDLPSPSPPVSHWSELHWQGHCMWVGCQSLGMADFGVDKGWAGHCFAGLCFCLQLLRCLRNVESALAGGAALLRFVYSVYHVMLYEMVEPSLVYQENTFPTAWWPVLGWRYCAVILCISYRCSQPFFNPSLKTLEHEPRVAVILPLVCASFYSLACSSKRN